jgi:dolichyl-phosphate beta-glucosyltransferase
MSTTGGSFGLVVPLFNEQPRFEEFGQQLVNFIARYPSGSELLFVDDGSTDSTSRLVEELIAKNPGSAVALLRRRHEGKGAAVAAGLGELQAHVLGFCDLDLSTPLDQLERVLQVAVRADVLAVGSRDLAGSRLTRPEGRVREALGRLYNRLLQATVTPGVVDTQCGAKVAAREIW